MTPEDAATLKACADDVASAAAEADAKWGVGRLVGLVGLDLRERFERQDAKWQAALEEAYAGHIVTHAELEAVRTKAAAMRRAYAALDAAAADAGSCPISPDVWEVALLDGTVAAFCRTEADAAAVTRSGRAMSVWTPAEIANVIAAMPALLDQAKAHFPGATVVPPRRRRFIPDQEIPF